MRMHQKRNRLLSVLLGLTMMLSLWPSGFASIAYAEESAPAAEPPAVACATPETASAPAAEPTDEEIPAGTPDDETLQIDTVMMPFTQEGEISTDTFNRDDILANSLVRSPITISTVKYALEGCTWLDADKDGIRQDGEAMLPGIKVTLYKLKADGNPLLESDYEVVTYTGVDGTACEVAVETGYDPTHDNNRMNAETGALSAYDYGRYQFTELEDGTYAVKFTDSIDTSLEPYKGTSVNTPPDDTRDSDATPFYNTTTDILEKTVILGITTSTEDPDRISRNNDSGFYKALHNLTITKTVTGNMGEHDREFEFMLTLIDAYGTPITGDFACAYTYRDGTGPVEGKPGTLSFTGGTANLTLKHGEMVIIEELPNHCRYEVVEAPVEGYFSMFAGAPTGTDMMDDAYVDYTNTAAIAPPTGVLLEIWPYALVVLLALGAAAAYLALKGKKKRDRKDENRW